MDDQWSPETTETRVRKERSRLNFLFPLFYKNGVVVYHFNITDNGCYRSRNHFKMIKYVPHLLVRS